MFSVFKFPGIVVIDCLPYLLVAVIDGGSSSGPMR